MQFEEGDAHLPRNAAAWRPAFTLVEILIVIGIIATLVTILLPTLSRVRENARNVQCAAQVRQVLLATQSYALDNDGTLPYAVQASNMNGGPSPAWGLLGVGIADYDHGTLWTYISPSVEARRQVMNCPTDVADQAHYYLQVKNVSRNFSYSLNKELDLYYPVRLLQVKRPVEKILVFEERAPNDGACEAVWNNAGFNPEDLPGSRHLRGNSSSATKLGTSVNSVETNTTGGRGNHGFADGHVEAVDASVIVAHNKAYADLLK